METPCPRPVDTRAALLAEAWPALAHRLARARQQVSHRSITTARSRVNTAFRAVARQNEQDRIVFAFDAPASLEVTAVTDSLCLTVSVTPAQTSQREERPHTRGHSRQHQQASRDHESETNTARIMRLTSTRSACACAVRLSRQYRRAPDSFERRRRGHDPGNAFALQRVERNHRPHVSEGSSAVEIAKGPRAQVRSGRARSAGKNDRALHRIPQLTEIPWPMVGEHRLLGG